MGMTPDMFLRIWITLNMDKVNMDNIYYKNTCVQMFVLQLRTTVFKPKYVTKMFILSTYCHQTILSIAESYSVLF